MRVSRLRGSVRGAVSNDRPYRDSAYCLTEECSRGVILRYATLLFVKCVSVLAATGQGAETSTLAAPRPAAFAGAFRLAEHQHMRDLPAPDLQTTL